MVENIAVKEPIKRSIKRPIKKSVKEPLKEPKKALQEVLFLMRDNPNITYQEMEKLLSIKRSALFERIKKLKNMGLLKREGGRFYGRWVVID